ncbi:hypothetical protein GQ44DRAFT_741528 [Phaeosphaeriaceae sp. PMI808]|nr:hypothetical protein GQ44DRAFT_741528 [Phaeosphaeriaceae sp. PMI808]
MFAPSFARVVRSTASVSASPASPLCRAALCTAPKPFRPSHQRRYSSSKSSIPPSNKKKPAAEELKQNAPTQLHGHGTDATSNGKVTEIPIATSMNNVPHVPPTSHIHEDDVKLSSFFALHRPMAFHREAWQQPASMEVFDAIFHRAEAADIQSIHRTKQTIHDYILSVHAGLDALDDLHPDAIHISIQTETHPFEEFLTEDAIKFHASQLPHFIPPPPPVAFDPFATTLTNPTVQEIATVINQRITEVQLPSEQTGRPSKFREHVRRRRGGMLLISVKRQRKLKMKKHKYKKLMKRTRLLRRKLDRT